MTFKINEGTKKKKSNQQSLCSNSKISYGRLSCNKRLHLFLVLHLFLISRHLHFNPAICSEAVLLLMSFVVVPVASGVATLLALMGLLARVAQHVPLQVHTLVTAVVANGALKGFGARMHPLVPLEISQVAAGIVTQVALVGFLASVYSMVPLEVVKVGGGVVTLRALVWLLSAVGLHVAGQVVRVVGEEGAGSTSVDLVPSLSGASGCVLS